MNFNSQYKPSPKILDLGENFYDAVEAANFPQGILRFRNDRYAIALGMELNDSEWIGYFSKFISLPENLNEPLALRYHGHQFRSYNPQLGDGRGFLFAQMLNAKGQLLDLGTKGSGQTPWSRQGDGRLTLKGAMREVLASEYLEAQKVNTSKAFSLIETGENLERHDEPSPTRSAVLVRLSHSHIRYGTFQRLAYLNESEQLWQLLEYSLKNYFPKILFQKNSQTVLRFFAEVLRGAAQTCADWMMAGFVHGVLNTDNMNITGESFDYGPYRFLPHYDANFVAAYFDHSGLYSYGNQPNAVYWNLQQLALSLSSLVDSVDEFEPYLGQYPKTFAERLMHRFLGRLGVEPINAVENNRLFTYAFEFLAKSKMGFEDFFFDWYGGTARSHKALTGAQAAHYQGEDFNRFYNELKHFKLASEKALEHPYLQKDAPVGLVIDEIERIWRDIDSNDNWQPFEKKIQDIRQMFTLI